MGAAARVGLAVALVTSAACNLLRSEGARCETGANCPDGQYCCAGRCVAECPDGEACDPVCGPVGDEECAPVPELCDGLDNDCDGLTDTDDSDIDAPSELNDDCGAQHCTGCNVQRWDCAGACVIGACATDQWNADGDLDNGCEYSCTQTGPERCDGLDNDCDNLSDTTDPDLDTQDELDASCAVDRCANCGVSDWVCAGNACNVLACDGQHKDVDNSPVNGCECRIESDADFCLRLGKDCDDVTATDICGDVRTVSCGVCAPPDVCGGGGGSASECRSWWNCLWALRRQISLSTTAALSAPYSVYVQFDHAALVTGGQSLAGGSDVRILRRNGTLWVELPRVADPEPRYGWNQPATRVWFATETSLAAGATDTEYFLYYGYAGAPAPTFNEDQVFHWADFFDRADSEFVGNGWRIIDASTGSLGDVDINANALFFETTGDYQNRPVAEHTFPAITTAIEWRFGFDWAQGTEATYRVAMQIGDSTVMSDPPNANDLASTGTGASLVWVSSEQCTSPCLDEQVVYSSTLGNGVLGTATGLHDFSIVADLATDTFEFWVDGGWRNVGDFYAARLQLDKIRFFTWQVSQAGVVGRRFTYTLVRPYVSPEPQATLAGVEQADCN